MGSKVIFTKMSRGENETVKLKVQLEVQLDRLLEQLQDLESSKEDLEEEEYKELREDTLEQVEEFQTSLSKLSKGNLGLVDSISAMQLAIQAAISQAFKTPEVIKMFAAKQPGTLRQKLLEIDRDFIVGKLDNAIFVQQKLEIIAALAKLGEDLTEDAKTFLDNNSDSSLMKFSAVTENVVIKEGLIKQNI